MKKTLFTYSLILISFGVFAQIGGKNTYDFLNLTNSARVASLGGDNISIVDNDFNLVFHNPALLSDSMSDNLTLNYVNYFSDINYGYVGYAKKYKDYGNFAAGIHYINYGDFTQADETGVILGNFSASEYSFNLTWAKKIDSLVNFGAKLKTIYSVLDNYYSSGIAVDAGLVYYNPKKLLSAAFVMKNLGMQIKPYTKGMREPLPFDLQLGISKKLKHAPLRFSFTAKNLLDFKMTYDNPTSTQTDIVVNADSSANKFGKQVGHYADEAFRHIIIGLEIIPIKNFFVNIGYNYQRRQELKIETRAAMVGFSFGVGIKISKFYLSYGRATYHLAGASNHISLSTNLASFRKKVNAKDL